MSKTILIITLSLIMLGGQVLAADVGKAAPAQAPSQKGQGQLPSKEVPPFKPIPICGEAQQACGEKNIVKEYVLVDPEKSFDRSLDILNLATAIMGIFMTAFTIFVAIVGALGFLEIRKWRKTRQAIDEDARAINKLKEGLEKDVDSLRGEIAGEIPPSLEVKPPKEVQEKLDELSRKTEFAEMLGVKLDPVDFYNRGVDLYYKNNFASALKAFDKAIELKPDFAEAWNNKGSALDELKRYEEALKASEKAIEHKPDYANAWNNKGSALDGLKRYEDALKASEKAIELKPDLAEAWYNKGVVLGKLERYEDALKADDKAIELKPNFASAWYNKGVALGKLERYGEALKAYDKAIELKPDLAEAWFNSACAYAIKGMKPEMLTKLKTAIEQDEKFKGMAKKDEDFKDFREDEDFKKLVD